MEISELQKKLNTEDLEEQRKILEEFIHSSTDEKVLDGIKISNEYLAQHATEFIVTSQIKE